MPSLYLEPRTMNLSAYSAPGLGAYVLFNEAGVPIWLALYGHGLDGDDLVLSGSISGAGTAALSRRRAAATNGPTWPSEHVIESHAGTAALTVYPNHIDLTLSLERNAIGGHAVDFSPMPESTIVATLSLGKLV
jgi:hypothetical protein